MKSKKPYFGGTGATLDKLANILKRVNIDGTNYKIENWFKEIEVFESLELDSSVWIPYGGTQSYGKFKRIEWDRFNFCDSGICTTETEDWFYYQPYLVVEHGGYEYFVYEYSFYEQNKVSERIKKLSKI